MLEAVVMVAFPLLVAFAASTDFLTMTIPNRVSLMLIGFFAVACAIAAPGWNVVGMALVAGLVVFAVGYALFEFGLMGGGDVKFAAAAALWLGWDKMPEFLLLFSLYGGGLTLLVILLANYVRPIPALKIGFLAEFDERRQVPYGIALAAAALNIYPSTQIVSMLH